MVIIGELRKLSGVGLWFFFFFSGLFYFMKATALITKQ